MNQSSKHVDVMMFGGRRTGKTSVLAAMQACFDETLGKDNLMITPVGDDTLLII